MRPLLTICLIILLASCSSPVANRAKDISKKVNDCCNSLALTKSSPQVKESNTETESAARVNLNLPFLERSIELLTR